MKQKKFWNSQMAMRVFMVVVMVLLVTVPMLAQKGDGVEALNKVNDELRAYPALVQKIIYAIAGIVGLIGSIRVYIKWQNGDQDVQKALVGWAGALIFLVVAGLAVSAFFGVKV